MNPSVLPLLPPIASDFSLVGICKKIVIFSTPALDIDAINSPVNSMNLLPIQEICGVTCTYLVSF